MKAIIMAGGEGTRLRPLTCDCPKPMMQFMNRPVMEYSLELLKKHGITQIAATLGYLPDSIMDYFSDGEDFGVTLKYYIEKTPLGTAGGVRQALDFLNETFIVLSGDGITDLNLTEAIAFHRRKRALATLVLRRENNPTEYGVVSTDETGRIKRFYEKPSLSDVLSDTINTGIYILEPEALNLIPEGCVYDFGHDFFPALVQAGLPVFGYIMSGYWCDIGDVSAYLSAHHAALNGNIHLKSLLSCANRIIQDPSAQIASSAVIEAPCLIGANAKIHEDAHLGAYSVIGSDCIVEKCASIKRSVLWHGAQLESCSHVRGCILAENAVIGDGAQAYEESILGSGACLGARSTLLPGIKLWPGKRSADGERLDSNLVWGNLRPQVFTEGTFPVHTPVQATRAAQACMAVLKPQELLLGRTSSSIAAAMWYAAAAGAMAQGVQIIDAGICTLPQLRHRLQSIGCGSAMLIGEHTLLPLNENGAQLLSRQQRNIITLNARQDFSSPFSAITHPILDIGQSDFPYIAASARCFTGVVSRAPGITLHAQDYHLLSLCEHALRRAGLNARIENQEALIKPAANEIGIWLNSTGEHAVFSDSQGVFNDVQQQLLTAWTMLESGERRLIFPVSATRAIDSLADRYNAKVEYITGDIACWMNLLVEQAPEQFALQFDGLFLSISALSALTKNNYTLAQWKENMPQIHRRSCAVPVCISETGRLLRAFAETETEVELGGGVRFIRNNGWAWICPNESKPEFKIIAESRNEEYARELCEFCENRLTALLEK